MCFSSWPVKVVVYDGPVKFRWHLIPAGFAHGALLAFFAVAGAVLLARLPPRWRWLGGLAIYPLAWLAGHVSWTPLGMSLSEALDGRRLWEGMRYEAGLRWWTDPIVYFGGVSGLLCTWLLLERRSVRPWPDVVMGCLAGTLGSLWFWSALRSTFLLSLLHGCIWGCLVGWSIWWAGRRGGGEPADP